jgi:hypothetical protein
MGTRSYRFPLGARVWPLGGAVHNHSPDASSDGRPGLPELHGSVPSIRGALPGRLVPEHLGERASRLRNLRAVSLRSWSAWRCTPSTIGVVKEAGGPRGGNRRQRCGHTYLRGQPSSLTATLRLWCVPCVPNSPCLLSRGQGFPQIAWNRSAGTFQTRRLSKVSQAEGQADREALDRRAPRPNRGGCGSVGGQSSECFTFPTLRSVVGVERVPSNRGRPYEVDSKSE